MKSVILNSKKIILGLVALSATIISSPAFASVPGDDGKINVTYVCEVDEMPVYKVEVKNDNVETYVIKIKDESGSTIHTEKISGANITRSYQLAGGNAASYSYDITVSLANGKKVGSYKVSKTRKVVEEVVITPGK